MNFKQIVKIVSLGLLASAFGQTSMAMEMPREELNKALRKATKNGDSTKVIELIVAGADINAQVNYSGETPLHETCSNNNIEMAKLLINHGADVNSKADHDITPLYNVCSSNGNVELAQLLISHGANINMRDKQWGDTPLQRACSQGYLEVVKLLINHGADINIQNTWKGNTALHKACLQNNLEVARVLINNGADLNVRNHFGETALDLANENKHTQIAELLTAELLINEFKNAFKRKQSADWQAILQQRLPVHPDLNSLITINRK